VVSVFLSTAYQQLRRQLNGISRQGKRREEENRRGGKKGKRSLQVRRGIGGGSAAGGDDGTVDSCQMLIKAKERKTLVSPAEGVASREMAGLFRPTTRRRRRRRRHVAGDV